MLNPLAYGTNMNKIVGQLFNHDDTDNDRSKGSKLSLAGIKTRNHWKSFYKENFALFGAMYRGMSLPGVLYCISKDDVLGFTTKKSKITVQNLVLQHPHIQENSWKNFHVKCTTAAGDKAVTHWFGFKGSGTFSKQDSSKTWSKVGTFQFLTRKENNLLFDVQEKVGFGFCGLKTAAGQGTLNLLSIIEKQVTGDEEGIVSKSVHVGEGTIHLQLQTLSQPDVTLLFLEHASYENSVIPTNIQHFWGPVSLEQLPSGVSNKCQVASHG